MKDGAVLRLYSAALRLYPAAFRRHYRADLLADARARAREPRHRGPVGRLRLALFLLADLARSVPREWRAALGAGRASGARRSATGDAGDGRTPHHGATTLRRDTTGDGMMKGLARDLRFALRSHRRRPGFAAAVILTLGLGIGAATVMVGVVDRVVLRPLPYDAPGALVQIGGSYPDWEGLASISPAELHRWRETSTAFAGIAGSRLQSLTFDPGEGPVILSGAGVSGPFFDLLGAAAWRGRLLGPDDDRPSAPRVAVLTHGAWTRYWGADPGVLGATVRLDRQPFTVVGVLPPDFVPPEAIYHGSVEVYFPLSHVADDVTPAVTDNHFLQALGRLRAGVTPEAAQEELRRIQQGLFDELPSAPVDRSARAVPLHDVTVGDFGRVMVPFLAAVGILLLVACANVANLFLVRAAERVREVRLRRSLGAGAGRILRQLLTESTLLCLAAAGLGALLAFGGVALFRELAPSSIPRASEVAVDLRVLAIAAGLGLATGVVFGLVPALSLLRESAAGTASGLRSGAGSASSGVPGGAMRRTRGALVIAEVAVALTLVIGAGLLANSFLRLVGTELGFEPDGVLYVSAFPEGERYETPEGRIAWTREVTGAIAALPGVASVSGTNNPPLDLNLSTRNVTVDGYHDEGDDGPDVSYHRVLPGFFETMGIGRVAGRTFTPADDGTGGVPVVVTEAMARAYWDADDPTRAVGGRLHFGNASSDRPWMEVVGVVADVRQRTPARAPTPELYLPWLAFPSDVTHLVARTAGPGVDEAAVVRAMRSAVHAVDPDVPIREAGPYRSIVAGRLLTPRFRTSLLAVFAGTALLLALVGVYATLAYSVRQRRHELGVRMALGAPAERLRAMVLGRGMALTAAGIVVGLGLSLVGTRLLESMVYGVTPTDPATFAGAAALLALAAVGACWLPARRATRVDPLETLRAE